MQNYTALEIVFVYIINKKLIYNVFIKNQLGIFSKLVSFDFV